MPTQSADDGALSSAQDTPPRHPAGGGGPPPHGGGGGTQLAALLQTQAEILRQLADLEQGPPHGPPPGRQGPPQGRPRPPPPRMPPGGGGGGGPDGPPEQHRHHRHHHWPPHDGGPPQGGPPPGAPPPDGRGRNVASNIARTLSDVASAAAVTAQAVPQIAASFHGTGADAAGVNPVWASLAKVLNEVSSGFRMTGAVAPEQESFLRVVEHLGKVVSALALNPNDPSLLAEYQEMSVFLAAHPDSKALSAFLATHPAIVPVVASVLAASAPPVGAPSPGAVTGWGGLPLYHWHYPPTFAEAPDGSWWPTYEAGQQLELVGPSIHRYRASGGLELVGPSIHRYRASGIHIDVDSIAHTLSDIAKAATQTASVVPQITAAFGAGYAPAGDVATGWVAPLMGGFLLGSVYRGWLDSYVSRATQQARTACAVAGDAGPVMVNPMWATLAKVLDEVSAGFRLTGVPPEKESFLRVVEHLGQVVHGLALNPNNPALLAEYQEMSAFLAAHPDSKALAEFIGTHPAIVPAIAPVIAAAQPAATGGVLETVAALIHASRASMSMAPPPPPTSLHAPTPANPHGSLALSDNPHGFTGNPEQPVGGVVARGTAMSVMNVPGGGSDDIYRAHW